VDGQRLATKRLYLGTVQWYGKALTAVKRQSKLLPDVRVKRLARKIES